MRILGIQKEEQMRESERWRRKTERKRIIYGEEK